VDDEGVSDDGLRRSTSDVNLAVTTSVPRIGYLLALLAACDFGGMPRELRGIADSDVMHDSLSTVIIVGATTEQTIKKLENFGFFCELIPRHVFPEPRMHATVRKQLCTVQVHEASFLWDVIVRDSAGFVTRFSVTRRAVPAGSP
jgi:hypothetical protein